MIVLEYVHENFWIARQPLDIMGIDLGAVMTVIRLKDGSLWVHSPIDPNPELQRDLTAIGPINTVISPNNFHHLYVKPFMSLFPEARYHYSPGLERRVRHKLEGIKHKSPLEPNAAYPWHDEIEHLEVSGMPMVNEYVFYHKKTRTLIASDLLFKLEARKGLWNKIALPLLGLSPGKAGQSRLFRSCIRDKAAYNAAIARLAQWDIESVIISHGSLIASSTEELIPQLKAV